MGDRFGGDYPLVATNSHTMALLEINQMIHKDYRSAIDTLFESDLIFIQEICTLKTVTARLDTHTPICFKVTKAKPCEVDPTLRPLHTVGL